MALLFKYLRYLEDGLLVFLLASMIVLATTQIILRNFFEVGLVWADPLLRVMVLWLGLLGATVASRDNRHIRIDLLSAFFKKRAHLFLQTFVGLFTAVVCAVIAWYGARWVYWDYQDGLTTFSGLPSWLLESIIPFAFGLISLRYFLFAISWGWGCYTGDHPDLENDKGGSND